MRTTNLQLTQEQEISLLQYVEQRVKTLRETNAERMSADSDSWLRYLNDSAKRKQKGTIFELSNLHLPLTAMIVEHFISRAEDEVAGEAPFFHFQPVGAGDAALASSYNGYFNWKLDTKAGTNKILRDTFVPIFVQRATILKAVHFEDTKSWVDRDRKILFDKTSNAPVNIPVHGPVIEGEDQWIDMPDPVAAAQPAVGAAAAPAMPGTPPAAVPTRKHLAIDPTVIFDPKVHEFRQPPAGLKRSEVLYRGGKSVIVPADRFLCPIDAPSVEEAELTVESYDKDASWYADMWLDRPWAKWSEIEAQVKQGDATAKTEGADTRKENLQFDVLSPKRKVLECWMRRDVLGWGKPQEFVVFVDEATNKAIFYEFNAKVCPDFKRPYSVISVSKAKTGWCAEQSLAEKLKEYQDSYDKQINAVLYRNWQNANPIKAVDPTATSEQEEDLIFDPTKIYHLLPGKKIEDFVQFATMPNADLQTKELADLILYLLQLWLGVSNLAQGDYQAIPQNNTATGIDAALEESSKLGRRWTRRIIDAFEEHLLKLVQITAATFPENAEETFEFSEGKDLLTGTMTAKDIRNMEINVRLVVSKKYNEHQIKAAEQAINVQDIYFTAVVTNILLAKAKRPLLIQILEALGYKNTDELLPDPETLIAQFPKPAPGGTPADPALAAKPAA